MRTSSALCALVSSAALFAACSKDAPSAGGGVGGVASSASATAVETPPKPREPLTAPERTGGALMRSADGEHLYLADEDHKTLRVLPLPFGELPKEFEDEKPTDTAPSASASAGPAPSAYAMASASASAIAVPKEAPAAPPPRPPPPNAKQQEVIMPGAPAQVLPVDGFVLATIRDPGLLVVLKEQPGDTLKEEAQIPVAADAWGLAITKSESIAVVTSAWTHKVTGVDWKARRVLWTLDVAREPRGVVIHPNGKTAYISHLTSGNLTRIDDIDGASPKAKVIEFPASPAHTPFGAKLEGSLGYALVMDDLGNRVLAARHALGALGGWETWYGNTTIDVLQTQNDQPLLKPRVPNKKIKTAPAFDEAYAEARKDPFGGGSYGGTRQFEVVELKNNDVSQPRAMAIARKSNTVWLAAEGTDSVSEYPLMAAAPGERPIRNIQVGQHYRDAKIISRYGNYSERDGIPSECGAPTGLALSKDESLLYVFCRSTYDIATIRIENPKAKKEELRYQTWNGPVISRVAAEPFDEAASRGRRLFYEGHDDYSSGGLGCAGCHPEGRDDGHVWHEVIADAKKNEGNFVATKYMVEKTKDGKIGYPRQTPMLAGRINSKGPYGWHAQNDGLLERIAEGFARHRWRAGEVDTKSWMLGERANALTAFLRKGLVPPPRDKRELTAKEKKGKQIFESAETACVSCHPVDTEFTNRMPIPLPKVDPPAGFEEEENLAFKVPSLLFTGGTAPYYHDGSMPTLKALIYQNNDRMGKTNQLSAEQKDALVAYLETL